MEAELRTQGRLHARLPWTLPGGGELRIAPDSPLYFLLKLLEFHQQLSI